MPQLSPPLKGHTDVESGLTSFFIQSLYRLAFSASGFLFLAFLAGRAVTINAGYIFSATVTKRTSSPATPYFCRVCWTFPASVKGDIGTRGGGRDRGGRRQNRQEGIWPIRASDQSLLFRLKSTDWSAFSQSCSCHRGLIIFVPFFEYIMYWLLSG